MPLKGHPRGCEFGLVPSCALRSSDSSVCSSRRSVSIAVARRRRHNSDASRSTSSRATAVTRIVAMIVASNALQSSASSRPLDNGFYMSSHGGKHSSVSAACRLRSRASAATARSADWPQIVETRSSRSWYPPHQPWAIPVSDHRFPIASGVSPAAFSGSGLLFGPVGIPRVSCQNLSAMGIGSMLNLLHQAR